MAGSRERATHGGSRAQKRMSEEEDDGEGADGGGRRDGGAKSDGQQRSHESQILEGKLENFLRMIDRFSGGRPTQSARNWSGLYPSARPMPCDPWIVIRLSVNPHSPPIQQHSDLAQA